MRASDLIPRALNRLLPAARPRVCADVGGWAGRRGLAVREIHPAVRPKVEPFMATDPASADCFARHRAEFERPQQLVCLEKSRLRGSDALLILPDGSFGLQGNWDLGLLQNHHDYRRRFATARRALPGDWFPLLGYWSSGYYHWLSDLLPRLHTALPHLPEGVRFLIHERPSAYQLQTLACYGIGPERLLEQPYGVDSQPERLWFATPLGHTSATSAQVLRAVAGKIRAGLGLDLVSREPATRLWISRAEAPLRRIVNEDELLPALTAHGVRVCRLEKLAWREQLHLLGPAEWVLGPHGAGLTNLIFAPHARLLGEVYHPAVEHFCYRIKAQQFGMRYSDLAATPEPTASDPQAMRIDPGRFAAWLDSLEETSAKGTISKGPSS